MWRMIKGSHTILPEERELKKKTNTVLPTCLFQFLRDLIPKKINISKSS